uniref:Uncharacterized protein n=1 Tax=Odontella aurita TaxID=265563 RepID=A0A7S4JL81_9STRA
MSSSYHSSALVPVASAVPVEAGEDDSSLPVASAVLADWEEHQSYFRNVLREAIVVDVIEAEILRPERNDSSGAAVLLRPPERWGPWPPEYRERFAMLAESLMDQEEMLLASRKRWSQLHGEEGIKSTYASIYSRQRLDAQAERLNIMRNRLEAAELMLPTELDSHFGRLERDLHQVPQVKWSPREAENGLQHDRKISKRSDQGKDNPCKKFPIKEQDEAVGCSCCIQ